MSINKTIFGITSGLLLLCAFVWFMFLRKEKAYGSKTSPEINIEKTWELPKVLDEISGIVYLGDNKIACVQDEDGIIFIYDLNTSKVDNQIKFGGNGDHEGIAVKGSTAYVAKSDGSIIEVKNFRTNPEIKEIETPLTASQDVEGLYFDKKNDRLLLAIKEREPDSENYKGVYAFDLKKGILEKNPVYKIKMNDAIFKEVKEKKLHNVFKPSEIAVHPETGEIYILEGQNPKLLVLNKDWEAQQLFFLNKKSFPQPEGLTFSSSGEMYISNEGNPATIYLVSLN
ncbi:MAG TPA: SdiA-regulated domain-containing protein [Salinimicrobium sp.]|nr:SdiA-regulated domain-containing protein [Salinimicrobium sp.]